VGEWIATGSGQLNDEIFIEGTSFEEMNREDFKFSDYVPPRMERCTNTWSGTQTFRVTGDLFGTRLELRFKPMAKAVVKYDSECGLDEQKRQNLPVSALTNYVMSGQSKSLKLRWPPGDPETDRQVIGKEDSEGQNYGIWTVQFKN
jgi:hypothetical protein